jgi:hypothetical protein
MPNSDWSFSPPLSLIQAAKGLLDANLTSHRLYWHAWDVYSGLMTNSRLNQATHSSWPCITVYNHVPGSAFNRLKHIVGLLLSINRREASWCLTYSPPQRWAGVWPTVQPKGELVFDLLLSTPKVSWCLTYCCPPQRWAGVWPTVHPKKCPWTKKIAEVGLTHVPCLYVKITWLSTVCTITTVHGSSERERLTK